MDVMEKVRMGECLREEFGLSEDWLRAWGDVVVVQDLLCQKRKEDLPNSETGRERWER